uniref:NAD_binding_1 domain-containing protein n=1 Tax=Ascaris lumbricoides TaxID=6252 RepID=A0A0M3INA4_ASCLU
LVCGVPDPPSPYLFGASSAEDQRAQVENFWKLESIGVDERSKRQENDRALECFDETVDTKSVGHGSNNGLSFGRLGSLMKRLQGDPELLAIYNQNLHDQEHLGIIEKVSKRGRPDERWLGTFRISQL